MIPLDVGEKQKRFLISAVPPHCSFCLPAGPDAVVEVEAKSPVTYTFDPIVMAGKFAVMKGDLSGVLYRLTDAGRVDVAPAAASPGRLPSPSSAASSPRPSRAGPPGPAPRRRVPSRGVFTVPPSLLTMQQSCVSIVRATQLRLAAASLPRGHDDGAPTMSAASAWPRRLCRLASAVVAASLRLRATLRGARAARAANATAAGRRHRQSARQRPRRHGAAGIGDRRAATAAQHAADAGRDHQHPARRELDLLRTECKPPGDSRTRGRPHPRAVERPRHVRRVGHQRRPCGGTRHADAEAHRSRARSGDAAVRRHRRGRRGQRDRLPHSVRTAWPDSMARPSCATDRRRPRRPPRASSSSARRRGCSSMSTGSSGAPTICGSPVTPTRRSCAPRSLPTSRVRSTACPTARATPTAGSFGVAYTGNAGVTCGASYTQFDTDYGTVAEPDVTDPVAAEALQPRRRSGAAPRVRHPVGRRQVRAVGLRTHRIRRSRRSVPCSRARATRDGSTSRTRRIGPFEGVVGFQTLDFDFSALGDEAFLPEHHDSRQRGVRLRAGEVRSGDAAAAACATTTPGSVRDGQRMAVPRLLRRSSRASRRCSRRCTSTRGSRGNWRRRSAQSPRTARCSASR